MIIKTSSKLITEIFFEKQEGIYSRSQRTIHSTARGQLHLNISLAY